MMMHSSGGGVGSSMVGGAALVAAGCGGMQCGPAGPLLGALPPPPASVQFIGGGAVHPMSPMLSPNGLHYASSSSAAAAAAMLASQGGVKPYRPWGAELAY
jgi:hypothetical protein